jgi:phage repressor protein C with HTH and peptisase S24 domain
MSVGQRIKEARKAKGWTQVQLGAAVGLSQPTIAEMEAGKLKNWPQHAKALMRCLEQPRSYFEPEELHMGNTPDQPEADPTIDYLPVEVLPTYGGLGGGGTGDGDAAVALLPRSLVTYELRAVPADLLVINVRGDSMEPLFQHGDQIVIDRRDTNPRQPGPFALWYDNGYVVKNVEIIRSTGKLRIFSSNPVYTPDEADPDDVTIMGRPVWFARRL